MNLVHVVGIDAAGIAGLTKPVRELIDQATLLVGSDRHLHYFKDHPAQKLILGEFHVVMRQVRSILARQEPPAKVLIVIFVPGDPLFFGLGRSLLQEFAPEQLVFHPNLSKIQLAFSRIKQPWQDARFLQIHGRSLEQLREYLQQRVEKLAILTEQSDTPAAIAHLYQSLDLPYSYHLWVCEHLGEPQERVHSFSLDHQSWEEVLAERFAPASVVILVRRTELPAVGPLPLVGIADREFLDSPSDPGLVTARELRLLLLGELQLQPQQVIWDLGAGAGACAIELARFCPQSQVYAVEKSNIGTSLIEQNCTRMQVSNVISIHGSAPEILRHLPAADRIWINNLSDGLIGILDAAQKQLKSGGLLVMGSSAIETLHEALGWFTKNHWQFKILQINLAKSTPMGGLTQFTGLAPTTLVSAYPLEELPASKLGKW